MKKIKILIVEDEKDVLEMSKIKLELEGFEVATALDGDMGYLASKNIKPDLILLDIIMPKVDGYEMLKKLKKDKETKNIPVVIFSNLSSKEEVEKGLKLGAKDFIIKSGVTPAQLAKKVKELLRTRDG